MQSDNNQVLRPRRLLKCAILQAPVGIVPEMKTLQWNYNTLLKSNKKPCSLCHIVLLCNVFCTYVSMYEIQHCPASWPKRGKYKSPLCITFFKFESNILEWFIKRQLIGVKRACSSFTIKPPTMGGL